MVASQPQAFASQLPGRIFVPGRSASLSSQIIADVRDALFGKKLKPGDVLGTENEIAARYGVSRIVARDALRTLEALGIAEIRMGKGGGARVARGNPRLFAEALAVQLDLTGVSAAEIMDAQRAIECLAAELAAENATDVDIARLRALVAEAEAAIDDTDRYTQLSRDFHLAVAEASHNRVLVVQLISLQHVSWPKRNVTLTPAVAQRILDVHKELLKLFEIRDPSGARQLMDDHVKMIRTRRVAEHAKSRPLPFVAAITAPPYVPAKAEPQPFVPAKAGTQGNKSSRPNKRPPDSRLRGNERSLRIGPGDTGDCC